MIHILQRVSKKIVRNPKGFTLMELIVSLAIFGIMTFVIFDAMYSINRYEIFSKELNYSQSLMNPYIDQYVAQRVTKSNLNQYLSDTEMVVLSEQPLKDDTVDDQGIIKNLRVQCRNNPNKINDDFVEFSLKCKFRGVVIDTEKSLYVKKFIHP